MKLPDDIMGQTKPQEEKRRRKKGKTFRGKRSAHETFDLIFISLCCINEVDDTFM